MLDAVKASATTAQEVPRALIQSCHNIEGQLTNAYNAVINQANVESAGASTERMEFIQATRASADQLHSDGTQHLNESYSTAKELIEDESSSDSNQ